MSAPPGNRLILDFKVSLSPPEGDALLLAFSHAQPELVGVSVGNTEQFGVPGLRKHQLLQPSSWQSSAFLSWPYRLPTVKRAGAQIAPKGWDSSAVEPPTYVRWRRYVLPESFGEKFNVPMASLRRAGGYQPAPGSNVILNFSEAIAPPPGANMVLEFGAEGYGRLLGVSIGDASRFGATHIGKPDQLRPTGFGPSSAVAAPRVEGSIRYVSLSIGIAPPAEQVGKPNLTLTATALKPEPFSDTAFGPAAIWNWRQYHSIPGIASQAFGTPALLGGVKYVKPAGLDSLTFGPLKVINTTADQTIKPAGITPGAFGAANVSPRIVYPFGILGTGLGLALVQHSPIPPGWDSAVYGTPLIYFKSRFIRPAGMAAPDLGYPRVADLARRILHVASPVTTVFGDTALRLLNSRVLVQGFDASEHSDWAEVRNRNRGMPVPGIAPGAVGTAAIRNKTPSFTPYAFDASIFGAHDVGYQVRAVRPVGVRPPAPALGVPSFWQTPALKLLGVAAPAVPGPIVENAVRFIESAGGVDVSRLGKLMLDYRYRHIKAGGHEASAYGSPRLEHRDRALGLTGFTMQAWGVPLLSMRRRFLSPEGITTPDEKGANHFVGGTRSLRPLGFEATLWGTRIIPEAQVLFPLGFGGAFGWPRLEKKRHYIKPDSIRLYKEPQQYFGLGKLHNARQFVSMLYDVDSELNPPRWPQWTLIENRDKRMGASGWDASKVAAPRIENAARVLLPGGMPAPALPPWLKTGMVAFRIRPLRLDGLEPPYISSWGNVRNAARLLKPAGLVATEFGTAKVENRSREFNRIGGWDSSWFGYPFVAPRIRELEFESRYSIAQPRIPLPTLQLHTRYLEPKGIVAKEVGRASLGIRFNRVTPRWTMVNYYGYPTVHNVTPELRQRGAAMDEWGAASMRLQWRPVAPDGANTAQLGKPVIADSRRTIAVPGTNMLRIGDKLTVTKTGVPPLALQYIWLDSLDPVNEPDGGHGITWPGFPGSQVGEPSIQQQVVYPSSLEPMTAFGNPRITANSIRVEPGIFDLTVGEPMVALKIRTLSVNSVENNAEYGKPRLTPHTIYAVTEAPKQAQANHPESDRHLVRSWAEFGNPTVQNRHRRLVQYLGQDGMAFGGAGIHNSRQYLYPDGKLMSRMGWPTLPGDTQVEFYTTINTMAMGHPSVRRPPYVGPQTIAPAGYVAMQFGAHRVENLHRTMLAQGHDSMAMGGPAHMDTPYMWRGLRVGPLMPTIPDGFNAETFGKAWISHGVRELAVEGFDAFLCEYDYQAFAQRMRVRRGAATGRPVQIGKPQGWRSSTVGTPGIRNHVHYVRPDGNAEQYRKGVPQ